MLVREGLRFPSGVKPKPVKKLIAAELVSFTHKNAARILRVRMFLKACESSFLPRPFLRNACSIQSNSISQLSGISDLLHTQSLDYVAEDIAETLQNWENQE